jgi:DedD protein
VNRHYDSDNDLQDLHEPGGRDREISLGTATILGIFFVLALLCAVFFGFGYSMGRRSTQTVMNTNTSETIPETDSTSSKPAPGSLASRSSATGHKTVVSSNDDATTSGGSASSGSAAASATPAAQPVTTNARYDSTTVQPPANSSVRPVSLPRLAAATTVPPAPVAVPGLGSVVVQVAAVSHQEDADMLTNALKKRGYSVTIRQVPQDKLLHVQIGPFANKKDADAMRQRLLADGYNAIVK